MSNLLLNNHIDKLNVDCETLLILKNNQIYTIKDLWKLKKRDLKKFNLTHNQINHIIIKMQLYGIDLNRRIYNKN